MLKEINVATVLQALKTGIAGTVAFYLSGLFHLPQGYWATMSAFIVLQGDATLDVEGDIELKMECWGDVVRVRGSSARLELVGAAEYVEEFHPRRDGD
jgi:hypothetical protein